VQRMMRLEETGWYKEFVFTRYDELERREKFNTFKAVTTTRNVLTNNVTHVKQRITYRT
jgi:hypothetical protein